MRAEGLVSNSLLLLLLWCALLASRYDFCIDRVSYEQTRGANQPNRSYSWSQRVASWPCTHDAYALASTLHTQHLAPQEAQAVKSNNLASHIDLSQKTSQKTHTLFSSNKIIRLQYNIVSTFAQLTWSELVCLRVALWLRCLDRIMGR